MMDPIEWLISLGNLNVAIWLNQSLGFVYTFTKFVVYAMIFILIGRKLYRAWKYNYLVEISNIGPERTIMESTDRGSIRKMADGTIEFRCLKAGKMSFIPDQKHKTPLMSKWWWQPTAVIKLYKYGSSNYSVTPVDTKIHVPGDKKPVPTPVPGVINNIKGKLKLKQKMENDTSNYGLIEGRIGTPNIEFSPVEPKLGAIARQIKEEMSMVDKTPWYKQMAPMLLGLIPFVIFGILLFFVAGKFVEAANANSAAAQAFTHASEKMATCYVNQAPQAIVSPAEPEPEQEQPQTQNALDKISEGKIPW